MSLAVIHGSTTLASFETTRVGYIILGLGVLALLWRGFVTIKLSLFIGFIMGALLPAFWSTVSRYTGRFPSAHLGSGPGLTVTLALFAILILEIVVFILESRVNREGPE